MKKAIIWFLIILVLVFTVIALLGVWEVIDLDQVVRKLLLSLVIIFASAAVILFIYNVMGKEIVGQQKKDEG